MIELSSRSNAIFEMALEANELARQKDRSRKAATTGRLSFAHLGPSDNIAK